MFSVKEKKKAMSLYLTALDKQYTLYKLAGKTVCGMIPQKVEEGENLLDYSVRLTRAMCQNIGGCSWMHEFYTKGKQFVRDAHERWVEKNEVRYLIQMFEAIILILPWEVYHETRHVFGEYLYTLKAVRRKGILYTTLLKCIRHEHVQFHPMTASLKTMILQI